MIDKQLEELSSFIDEVLQRDPIDFCGEYIKKMEQSIDGTTKEFEERNQSIKMDVTHLVDAYKKQDLPEDIILLHFFYIFHDLIKKQVIHSYAYMLGLEPSLYKHEMRLLFKGKTK